MLRNKTINCQSKIPSLNPFLDEEKIRTGGRLKNAEIFKTTNILNNYIMKLIK